MVQSGLSQKVGRAKIAGPRHQDLERVQRPQAAVEKKQILVGALSGGKKNAEKVAAAIVKEIEKPTTAMRQSFQSLPEEHQAFPVSMLDVGADTHDKEWVMAARQQPYH